LVQVAGLAAAMRARPSARVNADLGDRAASESILAAVPRADILVNNAGIIRRANLLDYSDDDWDAVLDVNLVARIPAGRWGTPDDLTGAVVFLASAASAYVHATTLTVDGGWLSR
jgi:NAD(P)-dependent dehydrogenase (short-subunit alcohol dehydrogenase family)